MSTTTAPPAPTTQAWLDGIDLDDDELHVVPHLTPTKALCGVTCLPGKGAPLEEVPESNICAECRRIAEQEGIEL